MKIGNWEFGKKWKIEKFGKMKNWKNGTMENHMVPYGTIWYHKVPYGTIWYHMIPPPRVGRDAVGTPKVFRIFDLWKKRSYSYIKKSKKSSKLIKYKGILTFWPLEKESPWNFGHFGPKIIENGQFWVTLWYFLVLN